MEAFYRYKHIFSELSESYTYLSVTIIFKMSVPEILTFALSRSPVRIQLLSTHTVYDLIRIVCEETSVGERGEAVDEHMWKLCVGGAVGVTYKLNVNDKTQLQNARLVLNHQMDFVYDFSCEWTCHIMLIKSISFGLGNSDLKLFPRREPFAMPLVMFCINLRTWICASYFLASMPGHLVRILRGLKLGFFNRESEAQLMDTLSVRMKASST